MAIGIFDGRAIADGTSSKPRMYRFLLFKSLRKARFAYAATTCCFIAFFLQCAQGRERSAYCLKFAGQTSHHFRDMAGA